MSIVLLVYLASVVGNVSNVLILISIVAGLLYAGFFVVTLVMDSDYRTETERHPKKAIGAILLCLFTAVLLPSEKTIYLMAGASIAQDIANSPKTAATLDKVYKIVEKKLDEQLVEKAIDKATDATVEKAESVLSDQGENK